VSVAATSGLERIAGAFAVTERERSKAGAALMPYLMGGFPDMASSRAIGEAYAAGGADLVELGVPFSDPLADGPVIQAAGAAALRAGATVEQVLELGAALASSVPVVVMAYANNVLARGADNFVRDLAAAGVSGLIVPDLPIEEAPALLAECDERGVALVPLVAPTTPDGRMAEIGARARGFLYTVSLTGTTGERAAMDGRLSAIIARAAAHTDVPVAVGFGIGTPQQATAAAEAGADGVIVGTRLVRAAGEAEDPVAAVRDLLQGFSDALLARPLG
jgi:tryptophan synthase alpha chain